MAFKLPEQPIVLREATHQDAEAIQRLADTLGYPSATEQVAGRLRRMHSDDRHCILVAVLPGMGVVGWLHVFRHELLCTDPFAEIGGFIVDDAFRGRGIGARLIEAAEYWAKSIGSPILRVRTRLERERAHHFYYRHGFEKSKTQLVLIKTFDPQR